MPRASKQSVCTTHSSIPFRGDCARLWAKCWFLAGHRIYAAAQNIHPQPAVIHGSTLKVLSVHCKHTSLTCTSYWHCITPLPPRPMQASGYLVVFLERVFFSRWLIQIQWIWLLSYIEQMWNNLWVSGSDQTFRKREKASVMMWPILTFKSAVGWETNHSKSKECSQRWKVWDVTCFLIWAFWNKDQCISKPRLWRLSFGD